MRRLLQVVAVLLDILVLAEAVERKYLPELGSNELLVIRYRNPDLEDPARCRRRAIQDPRSLLASPSEETTSM